MKLTGTETIETHGGRVEIECDADGITVNLLELHTLADGRDGWGQAGYARFTFAEWTTANLAVETFARALNARNAA